MRNPANIGLARLPGDLRRELIEAARNAAASAAVLEQLIDTREPALLEELERRELHGDRVTHDVLNLLRGGRLSAKERGNVLELAQAIDDVVDAVEATGHGALHCDCGDEAHLLAGAIRDAVRGEAGLVQAVIDGHAPTGLDRLHELQAEARRRMRIAHAEALAGTQPVDALRREHCLGGLRRAMRAAQRMERAIERMGIDS